MLAALQGLIAINAIGGGIYGLAGAPGVPSEWLAGSPFSSYLIPSLVLIVMVGGTHLVAALRVWTGHSSARSVSLVASAVLAMWIAVQVSIIGYVSWLQPTMGAAALLEFAMARHLRTGAPVPAGVS